MNYKIEKVLIIEWRLLPNSIKNIVGNLHTFGNDRLLYFFSELQKYEESLKDSITQDRLDSYKNEQDRFEIEQFLIDSKIDFTNVDRILFDICW